MNANNSDVALPSKHMVKFMINTNSRNKYVAKLIKVKDHEISRLLMAVCTMHTNEIIVKIIEVISSTVL